MNKIVKKLEEEKNFIVKFTEEEIESIGLKNDWKYSVSEQDGKVVLTPYTEVEIDFNQFDKELLIYLIKLSLDRDISMHEVVEEILLKACEYWESNDE